MGESGLDGSPVGAAQRTQNIEHHGHCAIPDLVSSLGLRLMDVVAQYRQAAEYRQRRRSATNVKMEIAHQILQRRSHVRRTLHQKADEAERGQAAVLPDQEPEMLAAGPRHTQAEQTASEFVGNEIVGVGKQFQIQSRLSQYLRGICTQVLQDCRNCRCDADPYSRLFIFPPRHSSADPVQSVDLGRRRYAILSENVQPVSRNIQPWRGPRY